MMQSPEIEPLVLAGLREIDPNLGLRWHPMLNQWMVMYAWSEDDPRRSAIRAQLVPESEAWDVLDYCPAGATIEETYSHVTNTFKRIGSRADGKLEVQRLLERVHHFNRAIDAKNHDEAFGDVLNYAAVMPTEARPKFGFVDGQTANTVVQKGKLKRADRVLLAAQQAKDSSKE
jgi:hypothetical protein